MLFFTLNFLRTTVYFILTTFKHDIALILYSVTALEVNRDGSLSTKKLLWSPASQPNDFIVFLCCTIWHIIKCTEIIRTVEIIRIHYQCLLFSFYEIRNIFFFILSIYVHLFYFPFINGPKLILFVFLMIKLFLLDVLEIIMYVIILTVCVKQKLYE